METTTPSPAKRMALAPIDANSKSPSCAPRVPGKPNSTLKRALAPSEGDMENSSGRDKKACLDGSAAALARAEKIENRPQLLPSGYISAQTENSRRHSNSAASRPSSRSPEPANSADSSMFFDQSLQDITQLTNITEPDLPTTMAAGVVTIHPALHSPPPPRRRRAMTREEARMKAEMLRLRLGLASYKVKTGQTEVPLERLQWRPFAPTRQQNTTLSRARASSSAATMSMARNAMQMAASMSNATAGPMSDPPVPTAMSRGVGRTAEDDDVPDMVADHRHPDRNQRIGSSSSNGIQGLQPAQPIARAS